jgi:hypothetical protein
MEMMTGQMELAAFRVVFDCRLKLAHISLLILGLATMPDGMIRAEPTITLIDPAYLPDLGQLVSDTADSVRRLNELSEGDFKHRTVINTTTETLRYGLAEGLVVDLAGGYSEIGESYRYVYPTVPESAFFRFNGVADPVIGVTYRALRQDDLAFAPFNLDLAADYSPNLVKSRGEPTGSARGGEAADLSLAASRVWSAVSLMLRGGATFDSRQKLDVPFVLADTDYNQPNISLSSRSGYFLNSTVQVRPTDSLGLDVGVKFDRSGSYRVNYIYVSCTPGYFCLSVPAQDEIRFEDSYSPYASVSYAMIPGRMAISLSYRHEFTGNAVETLFPYGSPRGTFVDRAEDALTLMIRLRAF